MLDPCRLNLVRAALFPVMAVAYHMKVTLEKGETLDVALVENDRIIGTLSL